MNQMRVDIELRLADMELKQKQSRWEPLKLVIASIAAGTAFMGVAVALTAAVFSHYL